MRIGFIGAGKVGFSLGKFFATGGVHVTGFYSRNVESAREAALFCNAKVFETLDQVVRENDAIFLTVPDGMISSVYQDLRKSDITKKQICHCSGAMSAREVFPDLSSANAYGYSIHPLFPVSDKLRSYRELSDAFFCLEGEGPHLALWKELLEGLGPKVQIIDSDCKTRYHAACAMASNLMCALVQESVELLEGCGFTEIGAMEALAPLMTSNLQHLIQDGAKAALTGPLERGDAATVEKHLACLDTEEERTLYRLLSRKLLQIAREKNPTRDYQNIETILKGRQAK